MSETQHKDKRYVGVKETAIYGIANGGQVFGYNLVAGGWLSFFFTNVFGIPAEAVGIMLLTVGIWDAINDPLMGSIIDKTRTRYGKLRPYLLLVPIPLAAATIMLFSGPEIVGNTGKLVTKIVYMYISYIIWEFFYTIGDVPFWGMSAAISPSPADRTRAITSARFISSIVGGISVPMLTLMMDFSGWTLQRVFAFMGILAGGMLVFVFSLAGLFTKERVVQSIKEPSILDGFRCLFRNKQLMLIMASNLIGVLGGIAGVFGSYYYVSVLEGASWSLIVGIPGTVMGFIAYALIPKLKKRFNKRQIMFLNGIVRAVFGVITFLIGMKHYKDPSVVVPTLAIQGIFISIFNSVQMVIPTEMIGDTIDYMEWKTGERNEGVSFSVITFISKLTGSLTTSIGTMLLPTIGYVISDAGEVTKNVGGKDTDFLIWAFFTIVPNLLGLLSLIPYFFYDLVGDKLDMIHRENALRRKQLTEEMSNGGNE